MSSLVSCSGAHQRSLAETAGEASRRYTDADRRDSEQSRHDFSRSVHDRQGHLDVDVLIRTLDFLSFSSGRQEARFLLRDRLGSAGMPGNGLKHPPVFNSSHRPGMLIW